MNTSEIMSAMIFGDGGASKVEELSTGGGSTDAGKVLVVGDNGKIAASDLPVGEGEIALDGTLTIAGAAADAKKTGDAIASLNGSLDTLINVVPTDTASGTIASFNDGANDIPVKSLTVNIEPIQSLHGYNKPWPAGGGINIWDEEWELGSYSNINGEPTTYTDRIRSKNRISVVPNTEYFFKTSNGLTAGSVYFYDVNDVFISARTTIGNNVTTTPDNCRYMRIAMGLPYGATYNNDVGINYPSTNTDYYPYSNVCPISGWTGAKVTRIENNLWDEEWELGSYSTTDGEPATYTDRIRSKNRISVVPNTEYFFKTSNGLTAGNVYFYDINDVFISAKSSRGNNVTTTPDNCRYMRIAMGLPYGVTYNNDVGINYPSSNHDYHPYVGTSVNIDWTNEAGEVFGGTLDITNGVIHPYKYYPSYNGETLSGEWISSLDVYSAEASPTIGAQVVDFGEFAEDISIAPQEVKTILGENNIFADTGDVSVEYRADIKKYIDKVVATAVSALS